MSRDFRRSFFFYQTIPSRLLNKGKGIFVDIDKNFIIFGFGGVNDTGETSSTSTESFIKASTLFSTQCTIQTNVECTYAVKIK
jgi:hypothetical protein